MYEQYSMGVYVKDIIKALTERGLRSPGKPFADNTVYAILKNEKYIGIYNYKGEAFDNIFPQIVPSDLFEKVRKKVEKNKAGKRSVKVTFLLRHKLKCGYCGSSVNGESGTSHTDKKKYYYKCRNRKKGGDCKKSAVRKDTLERIVLDSIVQELGKRSIMAKVVSSLLTLQDKQSQTSAALNSLLKEKRNADTAIQNILTAIESGVITNTTTKRLKELELQQDELERKIIIERSKSVVKLSEKDIRQYYEQALRLEPQMLISYLIKEIILYDDKINIHFNSPLKTSPDESQGFSFYSKAIKLAYKVPQRRDIVRFEIAIEMFV